MGKKANDLILPYLFFILFFSCASSKNAVVMSPPINTPEENDGGTIIKIDNPTGYNVYFDGGQRVNKKSSGTVKLFIEDATLSGGFDILYEIPLSAAVSLFCKGDHRTIREKQFLLIINEPRINEIYGTYIVIQNSVNNAISFYTGGTANPAWEQKGNPKSGNKLTWTDKREFSPGEKAVFDISRDFGYDNYFIRDSRKNISLVLPQKVEKNYVYTFEYSAQGVELTDSRPLHRIGERWKKTEEIENATSILPFVTENKEINLFASTANEGLKRIVYDSAGNIKSTIKNGDSFNIMYVTAAKDGFFIAGYEKKGKYSNKPIARVLGADGVTRRVLSESAGYESACFSTAAQKDADTWLLAGDGEKNGFIGTTAYARLILDEDNKLTVVKEWGGTDFPQCKNIEAVVYNNKQDCWLITGETIEPSTGYYLARINNDGTMQKISEFKGIEFYKILADTSGNYYLAGQEQKGDGTYAALIKYDANNKELWRLSKQPPPNSYYYTALLDIENNRIILAGTLQANDKKGNGGKPFIESVDMTNGSLDWREILSGSVFTGTNLVTAISTAPDYGYVLSLSGIKNGRIDKPYKIARLNSCGKYMEY